MEPMHTNFFCCAASSIVPPLCIGAFEHLKDASHTILFNTPNTPTPTHPALTLSANDRHPASYTIGASVFPTGIVTTPSSTITTPIRRVDEYCRRSTDRIVPNRVVVLAVGILERIILVYFFIRHNHYHDHKHKRLRISPLCTYRVRLPSMVVVVDVGHQWLPISFIICTIR